MDFQGVAAVLLAGGGLVTAVSVAGVKMLKAISDFKAEARISAEERAASLSRIETEVGKVKVNTNGLTQKLEDAAFHRGKVEGLAEGMTAGRASEKAEEKARQEAAAIPETKGRADTPAERVRLKRPKSGG